MLKKTTAEQIKSFSILQYLFLANSTPRVNKTRNQNLKIANKDTYYQEM